MAATTAGALKAKIESLGLGISAYRDQAPASPSGQPLPLPYVVIQESVAITPDSIEDGHLTTGAEMVQVDLYETLGSESTTLAPGLLAGLHGARLAAVGAKLVYVVLVRGKNRTVDLQMAQVRHIIDLDVLREL